MKHRKTVAIGLTNLKVVLVFSVFGIFNCCKQEIDYQNFVDSQTNVFFREKARVDPCFSMESIEFEEIEYSYYLNDNSDSCLGFRKVGGIGDFTAFIDENESFPNTILSDFDDHLEKFRKKSVVSTTIFLFTNISRRDKLDKITSQVPKLVRLFYLKKPKPMNSSLNIVLVFRANQMLDAIKHIPDIPKDSVGGAVSN